ncbi:hypothetical protein PAXRUDRAFT_830423 [Paxillus rubicundulus Ve08.2h10]|uniref:Uncharacterized protein n=1 Tax=Paxillus rubicundulus Ve08.2h10 TaxID=930991 RepID=A0A0D0DTL2_9AGAM|nr:hypothetical protein PAXRUDRAFT_830423 [Paxillus rubicundulus Ve08.2h10]
MQEEILHMLLDIVSWRQDQMQTHVYFVPAQMRWTPWMQCDNKDSREISRSYKLIG